MMDRSWHSFCKLVQEPFVFSWGSSMPCLTSLENSMLSSWTPPRIGTNRNALVWVAALKEWGRTEVNKIAREWASKRSQNA